MNPDLDPLFFATPLLLVPGRKGGDVGDDVAAMLLRAQATADFVDGKLSPGDFEEALFQGGIDPHLASDRWEAGETFL